jgi:NAD(P)-dependent dehydrogenase (short-subunit alcohol dehydrogenase family)
MRLLADKVVLVSGGSLGLGAGIASAAAREGAMVAVTSRNAVRGETVATDLRAMGAQAQFVRAEVTQNASRPYRPGQDRRLPRPDTV